MKNSRRDLFIDMAVDRFIFKDNQITFFPCFDLHTSVLGLPKTGDSFYCASFPFFSAESTDSIHLLPVICQQVLSDLSFLNSLCKLGCRKFGPVRFDAARILRSRRTSALFTNKPNSAAALFLGKPNSCERIFGIKRGRPDLIAELRRRAAPAGPTDSKAGGLFFP